MPEQYTYQVGKIHFIVTPVYKDKRTGETMKGHSPKTHAGGFGKRRHP